MFSDLYQYVLIRYILSSGEREAGQERDAESVTAFRGHIRLDLHLLDETGSTLIFPSQTFQPILSFRQATGIVGNEILLKLSLVRVSITLEHVVNLPSTGSHDLHSDPWSIVSLAFFLRYPNPYAAHVLSCDVISRTHTPQGTMLTTRLILKKGSLPKWAPKGIISRAESWILEESEVDPAGRVVRCKTMNLDHVKVMRVEEITTLRQEEDGWVSLGGL